MEHANGASGPTAGGEASNDLRPAGLPVRFAGLCIDIFVVLVGLAVVVDLATPVLRWLLDRSAAETALGAVALLALGLGVPLYFTAQWSAGGATVGMRMVGVRVVRSEDGGPVSAGRALARFGGYLLDAATGVLPSLACALGTRRRLTLHDLVSGTRAVRRGSPATSGSRTWSDRYTDSGHAALLDLLSGTVAYSAETALLLGLLWARHRTTLRDLGWVRPLPGWLLPALPIAAGLVLVSGQRATSACGSGATRRGSLGTASPRTRAQRCHSWYGDSPGRYGRRSFCGGTSHHGSGRTFGHEGTTRPSAAQREGAFTHRRQAW